MKRRPPGNRDPLPEEIATYQPYLERQIELIRPTVIAPLGRFSMIYFLPAAKISRDQGKLFRSGAWFVYPLFHPAAALRGTGTLEALRDAFRKLPAVVKKCLETPIESVPDAGGVGRGTPPHETQEKLL